MSNLPPGLVVPIPIFVPLSKATDELPIVEEDVKRTR